MKVNSSFYFGSYLYKEKVIGKKALFSSLFYYFLHKTLGLSLFKTHQKIFNSLFKGFSKRIIQEHVFRFLDTHLLKIVHTTVVDRMKEAQKLGHYVAILSSSPDFLVSEIAKRFQVHAFQATHYKTNNQGLFDQVAHVIDGPQKASLVLKLAEKLKIPISSITAYSDSYLDLPVLKIAGKAIGVFPDSRLKRVCKKNGWEIIYT